MTLGRMWVSVLALTMLTAEPGAAGVFMPAPELDRTTEGSGDSNVTAGLVPVAAGGVDAAG